MLEVRDVTKRYDGRAVVNRVSFEVRPGEVFALLGPNGAGKTTLIRMITDILRPDSGTIHLDGQPIDQAKRTIAYLPEERGLYRRSRVLMNPGKQGDVVLSRVQATLPCVLKKLDMQPFSISRVETQITASNDG